MSKRKSEGYGQGLTNVDRGRVKLVFMCIRGKESDV